MIRTRRSFLRRSLGAAPALLLGSGRWSLLSQATASPAVEPLAGGRLLGVVPFLGEGDFPLGTMVGSGAEGFWALDLSTLGPDTLVTPNERFFIRTGYPEHASFHSSGKILVRGLVEAPAELSFDELVSQSEPMGTHLVECSGNHRNGHFGLISVAQWSGVPVSKVLAKLTIRPQATRVLISGLERYSQPRLDSLPQTSWIFSFEQLEATGAFFATGMNGSPLRKDHGYPIRLIVPGWYACTCIKWVDQIVLVDDTAAATDLMREYAGRTNQDARGPLDLLFGDRSRSGGENFGPRLAKDFKPATIDPSAVPVRVEKWFVGGEIVYRIVGILWGGNRTIEALAIRVGEDQNYVPVDDFAHETDVTWNLWSHIWRPEKPDNYLIQLKVQDSSIHTPRLDVGYYIRYVAL